MAEIKYTRQNGIINIKAYRDNKIAIIGCGAIGSFTAISLAKMGLTNFFLVDFDIVEEHNIPNQFFGVSDIGKNKVDSTIKYMREFNPECNIHTHIGKFTSKLGFDKSKIVISCVDNMETRRLIFNTAQKDKNVQLLIDGRMNGLQAQIYAIDMTNGQEIGLYQNTLFGDNEAVQGRCTERSILFTVLGIASFICNQIVKGLTGKTINNYTILDYQGNTVY